MDDYLRAFDANTGAELWTGRLPATVNSTPTTYEWQGRQYVVIAAGGHGESGSPANDALVAFALPGPANRLRRPGSVGSTSREEGWSCTPAWLPLPWSRRWSCCSAGGAGDVAGVRKPRGSESRL